MLQPDREPVVDACRFCASSGNRGIGCTAGTRPLLLLLLLLILLLGDVVVVFVVEEDDVASLVFLLAHPQETLDEQVRITDNREESVEMLDDGHEDEVVAGDVDAARPLFDALVDEELGLGAASVAFGLVQLSVEVRRGDVDLSLNGVRVDAESLQEMAQRGIDRLELEREIHEVVVEELRIVQATEVTARNSGDVNNCRSHEVL